MHSGEKCAAHVFLSFVFSSVHALQTTIGASSHCQLPFAVLHMHGGLHLRNHAVHYQHQQSVHQCELC